MISVNKVFSPSQTLTFADAGVEGIVTKLLLHSGELLKVVLVYRSPNTPVGTFATMLVSILNSARPQSALTLTLTLTTCIPFYICFCPI